MSTTASPFTSHHMAMTAGLLALFAFSSCTPVYLPNTLFMPMLEEKGDISLEGSLGSSDISIHTAYAFSDHLAITGGGQIRSLSEQYARNSFMAEAGLAWFQKSENNLRWEVLTGAGYGQMDHTEHIQPLFGGSPRQSYTTADYGRIYLQANLHWDFKPLTLSMGSRLSHVNVFNYENIVEAESDGRILSHQTESNISSLFLEPNLALSLRIGNVSLFVQPGISFQTSGPVELMDHDFYMFNMGLRFNFNRAGKKGL